MSELSPGAKEVRALHSGISWLLFAGLALGVLGLMLAFAYTTHRWPFA